MPKKIEIYDKGAIVDSYKSDNTPINPDYYKTNSVEVIDMMIKIWGKDAVITHCEMCAFKYRMRLGNKPNNSVDDDLGKAKWYESKANELKNK